MNCHQCHIENPDNKKFCRECGAKLVPTCPRCKAETYLDDKFCGDCGHDLAKLAEPAPVEAKETEAPESGPPPKPIASERKHLTALFSDQSGVLERAIAKGHPDHPCFAGPASPNHHSAGRPPLGRPLLFRAHSSVAIRIQGPDSISVRVSTDHLFVQQSPGQCHGPSLPGNPITGPFSIRFTGHGRIFAENRCDSFRITALSTG